MFRGAMLVVVVLCLADVVHAQDDQAREHFTLGSQAYAEGDYETALSEFVQSHTLSGRPRLLYNIAQCHERLGNLDEAAAHLQQFLLEAEDVPNRAATVRRLENLQQRIRARNDEPSDPPASRRSLRAGSIVALATTAVAAAAWATFGTLALRRHDECSDESCSASRLDALDLYNILGDVSFGLTAAAAVLSIVLIVLDLRRDTATELSVTPTRHGAAVGLRSIF